MLRHKGGHKVGKGTYWNFSTGERVDVADEGVLPGNSKTVYHKLPATGTLIMGPAIGLLYGAFLPFIGIAMVVKLVAQKVASMALAPVRGGATFSWRPSESYLAGSKKKGKACSGEEAGKKNEQKE
jgi:hypothetical protein